MTYKGIMQPIPFVFIYKDFKTSKSFHVIYEFAIALYRWYHNK